MSNSNVVRRYVFDAAVLGLLSVGALAATARVALSPRDAAVGVAVVFAPWTSPQSALARSVAAGGRFVRFGGPTFVTVAIPDDADYANRVLAAGAWLVLDARALAACLSPFGRTASGP
jgi:hypothetical protein